MDRRSSIDLGTNTCLLLIAEMARDGKVARSVEDHATVVRLGQGVDQAKQFREDAMARTLACLELYAGRVRAAGLDPADTVCVATSGSRDARNSGSFFSEVQKRTGFHFKTISGDDEARFTFQGALLPGMDPKLQSVIDIGGGSTELISSSGGKSLDIGSVRFTERYLKSDPVTDSEFWACQEAVDGELVKLKPWRAALHGSGLVGVAGTATTLAMVHRKMPRFSAAEVDGLELTRGDVHRLAEELKWRSVSERLEVPGVEPGRADVLLAGAMILWRAMEILDFPSLQVSTRGLRYGILSA